MNIIKKLFGKETEPREDLKIEPKHVWEFVMEKLSEDHKNTDKLYTCVECRVYKHEIRKIAPKSEIEDKLEALHDKDD